MVYTPRPFTGEITPDNIVTYLEEEFLILSFQLSEVDALELRPVHVAPDKPREGMIVFADGTDWNPGAGKGVYTYLSGAWSKL